MYREVAHEVHTLAELARRLDAGLARRWGQHEEFVTAVRAAGRKKLIMTGLWTEACLTFPALDALREGYEVYPVVDAVRWHLRRGTPGGARPPRPGRCATHERGPADV